MLAIGPWPRQLISLFSTSVDFSVISLRSSSYSFLPAVSATRRFPRHSVQMTGNSETIGLKPEREISAWSARNLPW
jgi:hypothetical protein